MKYFASVYRPCLVMAVFAAMLSSVRAQTDIREHITGFAPDYFAGSSPPSALEMVQLLPGFQLVEGDITVRGYSGAVGNVLIDGRPPASKQDKLSDVLKRIPAASVEKIELMRPGTAGIDMQGYALLANVVRKISTAPRMRLETEYNAMRHGLSEPKLAGEFSLGSTDVLDLSAAMYREIQANMFGYGPRDRYAANGRPITLSDYDHPRYDNIWTILGTYRQPLLGGAIRINGLFKDSRQSGKLDERDYYPATARFLGAERENQYFTEVGLQYTHGLWDGGEGELIAIRRGNGDYNTQKNFNPAGDTIALRHDHTGETVFRLVERQRGGAWNTEAGIEAALNTLDNSIAYQSLGVPVNLPAADIRISEQRAEFFTAGTWHIFPDFALEAGIRYEMSQLKQQGDAQLTKTLSFLKPRLLATWNASPADEIRLLYVREAGQLNFNNFVSSVQVSSSQVSAGNKNLEPFTQWKSEAAWEHRFKAGSLVLTVRDEAISNVVDQIPFVSPQGVFDAVGNIGDGRRDEFAANLNLPLDWMRLTGFTLQAIWTQRYSRVIDPTVGGRRRISNDAPAEGSVTLTDDIAPWNLRWGATYTHENQKNTYRFNEIMFNHYAEQAEAFVEYKPRPEWLVRLSGQNLTDRGVSRQRNNYFGPRNSAPLNYIEYRPGTTGPRVGLNIQRTFGG